MLTSSSKSRYVRDLLRHFVFKMAAPIRNLTCQNRFQFISFLSINHSIFLICTLVNLTNGNFYSHFVMDGQGREISLEVFRGKVMDFCNSRSFTLLSNSTSMVIHGWSIPCFHDAACTVQCCTRCI